MFIKSDIPLSSEDFTIYTLALEFLYTLISSAQNLAFALLAAATGNYYNLAFSFHLVPITADWT